MLTLDQKYFDPNFTPETVSMESEGEVNGQAFLEVEFQIYGKINDFTVLENAATREHQEQWSFKVQKSANNAGSATMRVRSVNHGESYVRTTKTISESGAPIEVEAQSSKAEFDAFMIIAEQGMIKTRYSFPVDGRKFEVDVYSDRAGNPYPYVKIDLEIDELSNKFTTKQELIDALAELTLPDLPFELEDVTILPPIGRKDADNKRVSELYEKYFLTKNFYLQSDVQQEQVVDKPAGEVVPSGESALRGFALAALVSTESVDIDFDTAPDTATHYVVSEIESIPSGWYVCQGVDVPKMVHLDSEDYAFRLDDYPTDKVTVYPTPAAALETLSDIPGLDDDAVSILINHVPANSFQDIYAEALGDLKERLIDAQQQ